MSPPFQGFDIISPMYHAGRAALGRVGHPLCWRQGISAALHGWSQQSPYLLVATCTAPGVELLETISSAQLLYGQGVAMQRQPRQGGASS